MLLAENGNVSILTIAFLYSEPFSICCLVPWRALQALCSMCLTTVGSFEKPLVLSPCYTADLIFHKQFKWMCRAACSEPAHRDCIAFCSPVAMDFVLSCIVLITAFVWGHRDSEAGKYFKVASSHLCALHIRNKMKGQITHSKSEACS